MTAAWIALHLALVLPLPLGAMGCDGGAAWGTGLPASLDGACADGAWCMRWRSKQS